MDCVRTVTKDMEPMIPRLDLSFHDSRVLRALASCPRGPSLPHLKADRPPVAGRLDEKREAAAGPGQAAAEAHVPVEQDEA